MAERIEKTTGLPEAIRRMQDRVSEAFDRGRNIFDGAVVVNVEIDCSFNNTKRVNHKLGRKPQGTLLIHWTREGTAENWTFQATDLSKESVELQVFNDSVSGVYQLRVLVF